MKAWSLLICFILGCGHGNHHSTKPKYDDRIQLLRDKNAQTKADIFPFLDPTGWVSLNNCDGTLWSGMACAEGLPTNIDLAEYSPGEIHRRPYKACWTEDGGDQGSKSTISNDMFLGYFWCRWVNKDLSALQRVADFGEKNNWVMGKPLSELSRVYLKPNSQGLLGRMLFVLSNGQDDRAYRSLFEFYPEVQPGYEEHLQALAIALQGEVNVGNVSPQLLDINDQMLQRLHDLTESSPLNPLFHAVLGVYTGDFDKAITLLLDNSVPVPSYIGDEDREALIKVEWLFAAKMVLDSHEDS